MIEDLYCGVNESALSKVCKALTGLVTANDHAYSGTHSIHSKSPQTVLTKFDSKAAPGIPIGDYVSKIASYGEVSAEILI
jgi:hypothetical protein